MSLKKSIVLAVSIVSLLVGCVGWASAATLSSDRNSETECAGPFRLQGSDCATQSATHALVEAKLFAHSYVTHEELYRALKSLLLMQEACR